MAECTDKTDQNNIPNCPICMDTSKKPISLPCMHTFCESCIGDYIAGICKREPGVADSFPCPSCRTDTKLACDVDLFGDCGKRFEEKIPVNVDIQTLESEKSKICDVCSVRGVKTVAAKFWCQECQETLCDNCTEYHQSMKVSKSHTVFQTVEPKCVSRRCQDHALIVVTFYCFSHEQACCVKCAATKHRACENVDELEDLLQDPDFLGKNREIHDELLRIQSDLCVVLQNRERNAARLGEEHLDIKEKVTSLRNAVMKQVERMLSDTVSEAEDERGKESDTIRRDTDWLRDYQELISGLLSKVQVARQGSELDRFLVYREVQRSLVTLKIELPKKLDGMCDSDLEFLKNESFCELFQQFSKFGDITVKTKKCQFQLSSFAARLHKYKLMPMVHFKVSVSGDKARPFIRSVLFVGDNKLLMLDIHNNSLKFYSDDGTLLQRTFTRGKPAFLTRMNGNRYAVTEPDICKIAVYELSNVIKLISSIQTPEDILGIAFLNDVFILTGNSCVRVINQDGECLQFLDKNSEGNPMFSSPVYILGDPSENVAYVSDKGNDKVYALKQYSTSKLLKQKPLRVYEHPQLKTPVGLAIDRFGNLLVCGNVSGNVHLFDREGRHLKIVCSKITNPLNLEWDSVYDRLVLSNNCDLFQIQLFTTTVK